MTNDQRALMIDQLLAGKSVTFTWADLNRSFGSDIGAAMRYVQQLVGDVVRELDKAGNLIAPTIHNRHGEKGIIVNLTHAGKREAKNAPVLELPSLDGKAKTPVK